MSKLTVEEVKALKAQLERDIYKSCLEFEKATQTDIEVVNVYRINSVGESSSLGVLSVDVSL